MVTLMVTMAVVTMMAITDSGEGEDILLEDIKPVMGMSFKDYLRFDRPVLYRIEMANITTTESYTP